MGKFANFMSYLPIIGEPFAAEKSFNKNVSFQKEMADLQYNRDKEMFTEANKYNSPQMQMERLKQAGLNPNIVYGGGSATGNVAQNIPKYQAPNAEYRAQTIGNFLPVLSTFQNLKESDARIDAIKAGEENKRADTLLKGLTAELNTLKSKFMPDYYRQEYSKRELGLIGSDYQNRILGSKSLQEVDKGMLGFYQKEMARHDWLNKERIQHLQIEKMVADLGKIKSGTGLTDVTREFKELESKYYPYQSITNMLSKGLQSLMGFGFLKTLGKSGIGGFNSLGKPSSVTKYRYTR